MSKERRLLDEAVKHLKLALDAIDDEFEAMGDDWKDQPIMHRKDKVRDEAREFLAKLRRTPDTTA